MKLRVLNGLLLLAEAAVAHPGGGIVALSSDSAVFADPTENVVWWVGRGREPERVATRFHGHWMTLGRDGQIYTEAFQESGGAWSSAAFRIDLASGKLTEVAHRDEVGSLVFAVDQDGAMVFQRGTVLVSRIRGAESTFRPHPDRPALRGVTAYAWDREGRLVYADRNEVRRVSPTGATSLVAAIGGQVPEPRIWNATSTPAVFGLAVEESKAVLVAVPDLDAVYRIGADGTPVAFADSHDPWRATGVAAFGDTIFLLESDPRTASSPRVRILRADGTRETLMVPRRASSNP